MKSEAKWFLASVPPDLAPQNLLGEAGIRAGAAKARVVPHTTSLQTAGFCIRSERPECELRLQYHGWAAKVRKRAVLGRYRALATADAAPHPTSPLEPTKTNAARNMNGSYSGRFGVSVARVYKAMV